MSTNLNVFREKVLHTVEIFTYLKKSQKQSMFIKKVFDQIMNNVGEKYTNKKKQFMKEIYDLFVYITILL